MYHYVRTWQETGATRRMHDALREQVRVLADRSPQPTAAIIDSQSVKAADTVGKASRGYDAGKNTEGRKRHLAVDVMGGGPPRRGGANSSSFPARHRRTRSIIAERVYTNPAPASAQFRP